LFVKNYPHELDPSQNFEASDGFFALSDCSMASRQASSASGIGHLRCGQSRSDLTAKLRRTDDSPKNQLQIYHRFAISPVAPVRDASLSACRVWHFAILVVQIRDQSNITAPFHWQKSECV
jgi:hypothetical protein